MKIETKFDIGQDVWVVYKYWYDGVLTKIRHQLFDKKLVEITGIYVNIDCTLYIFTPKHADTIHNYVVFKDNLLDKISDRYIDDYWLFSTETEAEQKLKQLTHQHEDKGE